MTISIEFMLSMIVQVAITIVAISLNQVRATTQLQEKIKPIITSIEEIKALLGNGDSEGIFLRKDVASEMIKRRDEKEQVMDEKIHALDTEIKVVKKYLMEKS